MTRMYSPSPTVKSSRVPLYLRGWMLGQDSVDFSAVPDVNIDPTAAMFPADTFTPTTQAFGPQPFIGPEPSPDVISTNYGPPLNPSYAVAGTGQTVSELQAAGWSNDDINTMIQTSASGAAPQMSPLSPSSPTGTQLTTQAVSSLMKALTPGPAPRVAATATAQPSAASFLTQSTMIAGVPNWVLLAGGIAAVALLMGGKR
jgi:hypothetical protein